MIFSIILLALFVALDEIVTLCRRGISTILGTLIFVGIIFTAVIPMLLVMNQVDTLHEMRKYELELLDNERLREDLHVFVFPTSGSSDLTLRIVNRGDFVAKIVKTWINDDFYPEDIIVQPMAVHDKILIGYFIPDPGKYYFTKVTTDMGNIFFSDSGSIQYLGDGEWDGGIFMINIVISCDPFGWFNIVISYEGDEVLTDDIHKSSADPAFGFYPVALTGTYHVTITRGSYVIYDNSVVIDWPSGPPIVWVFT